MSEQVYPTVDPAELEPEYSEHLKTIAGDWPPPLLRKGGYVQIHRSKVENAAAQLALRDRELLELQDYLGQISNFLDEEEREPEETVEAIRNELVRLERERDAALARVRELEEALHRQERLTIEANESLDRYIESEQELRARILELTEWRPMEWVGMALSYCDQELKETEPKHAVYAAQRRIAAYIIHALTAALEGGR